jgi:hypothetical protein
MPGLIGQTDAQARHFIRRSLLNTLCLGDKALGYVLVPHCEIWGGLMI